MLPLAQLCSRLQPYPMRIISHIKLQRFSLISSLQHKHSSTSDLNYQTREKLSLHKASEPSSLRTSCLHPSQGHASLTSVRWKQTQVQSQSRLGDVESKEFIELYFIQNISFLRVLCRFSKLSVLMFLFATPASILTSQLGVISSATGTNIVATFGFYAVFFTAQSWLFSSRVIGKIMMSSDEEVVKVSHMSVFGERRDIFLKPSDFLPDKKDRGGGYVGQNLCHVRIRCYPKRLFYLPNQGHVDTDHERIDLLLSGDYSKTI